MYRSALFCHLPISRLRVGLIQALGRTGTHIFALCKGLVIGAHWIDLLHLKRFAPGKNWAAAGGGS